MNDDEPRCELCRYFKLVDGFYGLCKRYPKVRQKGTGEWCGEFDEQKKDE